MSRRPDSCVSRAGVRALTGPQPTPEPQNGYPNTCVLAHPCCGVVWCRSVPLISAPLSSMMKAEYSCCCCHQLPYIFVQHLIVFRPGAAKEKLTFVSCQFALVLSFLVISNALCACCCCVLLHPCCCIAHVSLLVLRSPSLSPCSIRAFVQLAERKTGPHVASGTSREVSILGLLVGLLCFFLGFGRCPH